MVHKIRKSLLIFSFDQQKNKGVFVIFLQSFQLQAGGTIIFFVKVKKKCPCGGIKPVRAAYDEQGINFIWP